MLTSKSAHEQFTTIFDRVQFDYEGCTYAGPAVGHWNPDDGLLIEGTMRKVRGNHPPSVRLGVPQFAETTHFHTLRLRSAASERSVVFLSGRLRDQFGLLLGRHLDLRSAQFITFDRETDPPGRPNGRLVFDGSPGVALPDRVTTEVQVNHRPVAAHHRRGLDFQDDGYELLVVPNERNMYTIWWQLPDRQSMKGRLGVWPHALALAWQVLTGESVLPLASEFSDARRRVCVFTRRRESVRMGRLSLMEAGGRDSGKVLLALSRLFASQSPQSEVAHHLLAQCFDAARSTTWQAKMFLLGTALEAILRTLYQRPYEPGKRAGSLCFEQCISQLWSDCFSPEWASAKGRIGDAYKRVRHRAAHPDWLRSFGGACSPTQHEETFNDLVLLSRFYGYLILAMAGVPNVAPRFPPPVAEWRPIATFGSKSPNKDTAT